MKRDKYIIVANGKYQKWAKYMFLDVEDGASVFFFQDISDSIKSRLYRFIYRLKRSGKYSKFLFFLSLEKLQNKINYKRFVSSADNVCFVFFLAEGFSSDPSYLTSLRKNYPESRFVLICTASVKVYEDFLKRHRIALEELYKLYDHVELWDKKDADKYGVFHYKRTYSLKKLENHRSNSQDYDLLYIGYAKNRLEELVKCYDFFSSNGVKCLFLISGVSQNERISREGIVYKSWFDYDETIDFIRKTNAVLEIILNGMTSSTIRLEESIAFKKRLITNNACIVNDSLYDPDQVRIMDYTVDDIAFVVDRNPVINKHRDLLDADKTLLFYEENICKVDE